MNNTDDKSRFPFFANNKILTSYKNTFILLVFFGIFYWGPILYESHFIIFNSQYKMVDDITLYFFPFLFFFMVNISRNIRSGINRYFKIIKPNDKTSKDEERENNLINILEGTRFSKIQKRYLTFTKKTNEAILSIILTIVVIIGSYGLVWTLKGFEYLGKPVSNWIIISSLVLLIIGIIFAIDASSGLIYHVSFIVIIANLKRFSKDNDDKIKDNNPFKIFSINNDERNINSEGMSYANFYANFKEISDFITFMTFELLIVSMIFSMVFIANEFISNHLSYTTIFFLLILPFVVFCLFLYPQVSIFLILRDVKKNSQNALDQKYFEKQKRFFKMLNENDEQNVDEKNKELEELERILNILASIQEKEEKVPIWPINIQIIVTFLVTLFPTLIGFLLNLIK